MVAAREPLPELSKSSRWSKVKDLNDRLRLQVIAVIAELVPKGLYARALIIIIAPIVLLEGVVAFVFMERHWNAVTRRLSEATVRDIAALIDVYQDYSRNDEYGHLIEMARDRLNLSMQVLPPCRQPNRVRSSHCSTAP